MRRSEEIEEREYFYSVMVAETARMHMQNNYCGEVE